MSQYESQPDKPNQKNHICAVAIIVRNRKVLMGLREYKKGSPLWTFPGGRCDYGEKPEVGLVREVKEEVGFSDLQIKRLLGGKEGVNKGIITPDQVFIYECSTEQEPRLMEPEKFLEWRWMDPENLPSNTLDPDDVRFVKMVM